MEKIWEFFENLNEYVYAADVDSFDLVYMNRKTRETYGITSMEELSNRKCYEVLNGNSTPCAFCNNADLEPGKFKEWSCYNPIVGKHLSLKDTIIEQDGRRYRIEIAIDVSTQVQQGKALLDYQNLEKLANEGFRIALQAPTPDKTIDVILEYLGKALQGERTYIFEKNAGGGDDNTYEWVANGVTPEIDNLQNLPPEVCANWYRKFGENENILIEDLEDIREEDPLQYENLKRQDIHSLAVVPLFDDGKVIGFYGVDNPPGESLIYAQNMLQIVGHFIVSCIKRRNLLKELKNMSYCDQLTGIGNRHALYEYIANIKQGEHIGVVYCDITGLKRVNDTQGHEAGDNLILQACQCLKNVFGLYGLFRIGGDELLVLCPKIGEDELKEKVQAVKKEIEEHAVAMAIGSVWKKDGSENVERLITESEKLMYQDKAAYYKKMGIDRRKY